MTQGRDGDETPNSDNSELDQNESNNPRKRRLSPFEVSEIVVEEIKSVMELQALAKKTKN